MCDGVSLRDYEQRHKLQAPKYESLEGTSKIWHYSCSLMITMNQRGIKFFLTSPLWIEKSLWRAIVVTGISSCSEETRSRRFIPKYQPEEIGGHLQEVLHWPKFDKQRKTNLLKITKLAPWHSRRGRETCHTCKPFKGNLNIYIQQLIQLQCLRNPPDMTWNHQKRWEIHSVKALSQFTPPCVQFITGIRNKSESI